MKVSKLPSYCVYGTYSGNYGTHALMFTDAAGNDYYFSYKTMVAFRGPDGRLVVLRNYWGSTTGRHLNAINDDKKSRVSQDEFAALFRAAFKRELADA